MPDLLRVTLPSGEVFCKKSSRDFTHAVCYPNCVISWCKSYRTAEKAVRRVSGNNQFWQKNLFIVEVERLDNPLKEG